jgi:hypothetical protein
MGTKIGILVGREWSLPPALIRAVEDGGADVSAEYVKLGTPTAGEHSEFPVIIDRISQEVPFYRSYLRRAAIGGTEVINDPFALDACDRFVASGLAQDLGIQVPASALLPHRDYAPEIVHEESLRNLDYPLDWQAIVDHVGSPFILRDARLEAAYSEHECQTVEELLAHYNRTGQRLMMIQRRQPAESTVRCLVIGDQAMTLEYRGDERKYGGEQIRLETELGESIIRDSLAISHALGLDVNAVDWAISESGATAIDLVNPVPELDVYCMPEPEFERVVNSIADLAVALAADGSALDAGRARRQRLRRRTPAPPEDAGELAEGLGSLARGLPRSKLT